MKWQFRYKPLDTTENNVYVVDPAGMKVGSGWLSPELFSLL